MKENWFLWVMIILIAYMQFTRINPPQFTKLEMQQICIEEGIY